jgi:hypothetical protein
MELQTCDTCAQNVMFDVGGRKMRQTIELINVDTARQTSESLRHRHDWIRTTLAIEAF